MVELVVVVYSRALEETTHNWSLKDQEGGGAFKELDAVSASAPIDKAPTVWLTRCVPSHLLLRMNLSVGYYRQNHSSEGSSNLLKV